MVSALRSFFTIVSFFLALPFLGFFLVAVSTLEVFLSKSFLLSFIEFFSLSLFSFCKSIFSFKLFFEKFCIFSSLVLTVFSLFLFFNLVLLFLLPLLTSFSSNFSELGASPLLRTLLL